jgi:hypothetical protein
MSDTFFQMVLFFAGLAIGIAVPLWPKQRQKWIAGVFALLCIATSLVWVGYELGNGETVLGFSLVGTATPTNTPEPADTPTHTPEPSDTATRTPEPADTPTRTPEPSDTPTRTPQPADTPTDTPTVTAIAEAPLVPTPVPSTPTPETVATQSEPFALDLGIYDVGDFANELGSNL